LRDFTFFQKLILKIVPVKKSGLYQSRKVDTENIFLCLQIKCKRYLRQLPFFLDVQKNLCYFCTSEDPCEELKKPEKQRKTLLKPDSKSSDFNSVIRFIALPKTIKEVIPYS